MSSGNKATSTEVPAIPPAQRETAQEATGSAEADGLFCFSFSCIIEAIGLLSSSVASVPLAGVQDSG